MNKIISVQLQIQKFVAVLLVIEKYKINKNQLKLACRSNSIANICNHLIHFIKTFFGKTSKSKKSMYLFVGRLNIKKELYKQNNSSYFLFKSTHSALVGSGLEFSFSSSFSIFCRHNVTYA